MISGRDERVTAIEATLLKAREEGETKNATTHKAWDLAHSFQENHIKEQAAEIEKLKEQVVEAKRKHREPTHGSCCTCQRCGLDHDACRCDLDDVADQLQAAEAKIAELEIENTVHRETDVASRVALAQAHERGVREASDFVTRHDVAYPNGETTELIPDWRRVALGKAVLRALLLQEPAIEGRE